MKTPQTTTNVVSAPIITQSLVHETLLAIALDLEMKPEECTATQYGMLIMILLNRLDISGRPTEEFLPLSLQAWTYIPKNPSAMRQLLNKEDKASASPAVSALLAKFLPKPLAE
jgi:hypothetical protein